MKQSFSTRGLPVFIILFITFIAFLPSLHSGFTNWDDEFHFLNNPNVLNFDWPHFWKHWTTDINKTYIPLTTLSFAIEHYFFGFNPFVFHLINLIFHLAVVTLIFWFALRMGLNLPAASLAALLFGIHPMRVEAVVWLTELKDVLYAFFYMLALHHYWTFIETKKRTYYLLSLLWGILSILAKPMALSLPLILFLCDWWTKRQFGLKLILEKIPYFLSIFPIGWITYSLNAGVPIKNFCQSATLWVWTLTSHVQIFLFPAHLSPIYAVPKPISFLNPPYWSSFIFLLCFFILIIIFRRSRLFKFALLYYFLSIFFLLRFHDDLVHVIADRFMYLPSLGFCLLFGFLVQDGLEKLKKKSIWALRLGFYSLVILFIALFSKTFLQNYVWAEGLSLWEEVIQQHPKIPLAYYNRAKVYESINYFDSAILDYGKAIALKPDFAAAYNNRGILYYLQKKYELALPDLDKALKLDPDLDKAYNSRGNLYYEQGKYDLAITDYTKALQLTPQNLFALCNRGVIHNLKGEEVLALADFNQALKVDPQCALAYANRGNLYSQRKEYDLAIKDYTEALKIDPKMEILHYNTALVYEAQGDYAKAIEEARKLSLEEFPEAGEYILKLEQLAKTK